ncbi:MAG: ATPase domain-containing protein [Candidatus Nanoarchaeia archaeon]|nr:hypothetical protein [Candidatus Haiyanarchaeum thermophilum]MCW1308965.1 hypothetical protein [Candidatus Haiyanarchaeum thermophilum]
MAVERVPSGIPGLDPFIGGGFEKGSLIVLEGGPGSGKTIFSIQFIYEGLKRGERCVYITFEERENEIIEDAASIKIDLKEFIHRNLLLIKYFSPLETDVFLGNFEKLILEFNPQRVVIDSVSVLNDYAADEFASRKLLHEIGKFVQRVKCTTIIVSELSGSLGEREYLPIRGIEEFVADTVIQLFYTGFGGEYDRSMRILKMRRTNHYRDILPLRLNEHGLAIGEVKEA